MSNPELPARSVHEKMLAAARQPVPLVDVEVDTYLGGGDFDNLQLGGFVLNLLCEIAKFRKGAISYRGFDVAAGALCVNGPRFSRLLGPNIKVDDTDTINIHAEDVVMAKAEYLGYRAMAVLGVIGPTQEDHASGRETPTLHPCGRCRERLQVSELITPDTLIVTARPDFTVVQIATLDAIIDHHDTGNTEGIATFRYERTPAVFQPQPEPVGVYAFKQEVYTEDYDATIGQFLLHRYNERHELA